MAALDTFTTLMQSTGPAWMTGPEVIVNDALRTTYTGNRIASAGNMVEMIQGGDQIEDIVYLTEAGGNGSGLQRYDPNDAFEYDHAQPGTKWTAPWAFAWASMSWTKQDIGLNVESMGKKYRSQVYKRVMYEKHQNLFTRVCNGMEDEFWAVPKKDDMEDTSPTGKRQPYSIPVFVNEFSNGLIPEAVDASETAAAWTSVQGITVADHTNWAPYSVGGGTGAADNPAGYDFDAGSAAGTATLFPVFTKAWWNLRFDRLPKGAQYSDKTSSPQVIWCSLQGIVNYEHALLMNQDTFRGAGKASGQDPAYDGPTFRNTPLEYIASLDTATLYSDGTSGGAGAVDETSTNSTAISGPRYYWMNTNYLKFIVHNENYCTLTDPISPSDQPFTRVQVMDLWNNTVCRSRKRLGIVGPKEDAVNA
jgi:hypothetical protein